jgi:hypothetical protein
VLERQLIKPQRNRDTADERGVVLADQDHGGLHLRGLKGMIPVCQRFQGEQDDRS